MSDFAKWKLDFSSRAVVNRKTSMLPDPPGYDAAVFAEVELDTGKNKNKELEAAVIARKELALRAKAMEPLKQVGFMCFMLWMSGNSLQLFSIMMLSSCIYTPCQAIANVTKTFPKNKDVDVMIPRALYCAVYFGQLIFAAYKLDKMGLLPTHASDWASQIPPPVYLERAYGPGVLM
jgi:ER membrane protein complex subunit 4